MTSDKKWAELWQELAQDAAWTCVGHALKGNICDAKYFASLAVRANDRSREALDRRPWTARERAVLAELEEREDLQLAKRAHNAEGS